MCGMGKSKPCRGTLCGAWRRRLELHSAAHVVGCECVHVFEGGAVWLDANSLVEELGCERHCGAQKVQSVSQNQSRVCVESLVEHFFTPTQSNNKKERIVNCASMLLSIEMCCKKSVFERRESTCGVCKGIVSCVARNTEMVSD